MSNDDGDFKFGRQFQIPSAGPEKTYPVTATRWDRMINRLEDAEDNRAFYHSAAWTLVGVAASSFLSAILLPHTSQDIPFYVEGICWSVFGAALVISAASFHFSSVHHDDREKMRVHVIQDMKDVRNRYNLNENVEA